MHKHIHVYTYMYICMYMYTYMYMYMYVYTYYLLHTSEWNMASYFTSNATVFSRAEGE